MEALQTKHRNLLNSDGSKKERQLRQEILALEKHVRYWSIPDRGNTTPHNGRSGKYSRTFNGPNSGSGSALVAMTSRLLCELPSPTLDVLDAGKSLFKAGVIKGPEDKRFGMDIIVTSAMQMRDKKLSSQKK